MLHTDNNTATTTDTKIAHIKTTEEQILELKETQRQIKILTEHKKRLETTLLDGYFAHHKTYVNGEGLTIASRKDVVQMRFDSTKFKTAHPKMYQNYCTQEVSYSSIDIKKHA